MDQVLSWLKTKHIPVYCGMDFNVGHMACVAAIQQAGKLYVVKEYIDYMDTPELIDAIKRDFPASKVVCYPDASGVKRGSVDAGVSDIALLRKAGFMVRVRPRNPFIKDRVASVNNAFAQDKLFVDTTRCPELTEALEQQIWAPNGTPDKTTGLDHVLDALGYMVSYMMPIRELKPITTAVVS